MKKYKKYTQDEVINLIKTRWPEADCSKVNYINCKESIVIICPKHGEFSVTLDSLLNPRRKYLCKECMIDAFKIEFSLEYLENLISSFKGSKTEFNRKHGSEYAYIKRNNLDYLLDAINPKISTDKQDLSRLIYVYEFQNKIAYVGLTCNVDRRDSEHRFKKGDNLFEYCKDNNIILPKVRILETGLSASIAGIREAYWENYYRVELGWVTLNKYRCGSLGGHSGYVTRNIKSLSYTIDDCKNIVLSSGYKNITECCTNNYVLYRYIKYRGWENNVFPNYKSHSSYDLEKTREIFEKYSTVKDLRRSSDRLVYESAKDKGWITKYKLTSHMKKPERSNFRSEKECLDIIIRYDTFYSFRKENPQILRYIKKNNWDYLLDDLFKRSDKYYIDIIKRYTTRKDFINSKEPDEIKKVILCTSRAKIREEYKKLPLC